MSKIYSPEVEYILKEARDLAESQGKPLGSVHILFAFFVLPNSAEYLLKERKIDEDKLLSKLGDPFDEPPDTVARILAKADEITGTGFAREITALHLLVAIMRTHDSVAYRALKACGVNMPSLRNTAMSYIAGEMPRKYVELFEEYRDRRRRMLYDMQQQSGVRGVQTVKAKKRQSSASARVKGASSKRQTDYTTDIEDWRLPENFAPTLAEVCRNLTEEAAKGMLDPLVGREEIIEEILDVLGKRRSNNPCLIGEPGVGKTAIVEGLARKLVEERPQIPGFEHPILLLKLEVAELMSGTQYRGALAEKIAQLKQEVAALRDRVIIFIDEIHTIAQPSTDGTSEIARELKDALARGEFPCIGATTPQEYKQSIAADPALARRFHPIDVPEPRPEEAHAILRQIAPKYEEHHGVVFTDAALDAAVRLSLRYLPERRLPDKAINLIDLAGSRARRDGRSEVSYEDLARIVSSLSGVPEDQISLDPSERLAHMEQILSAWIVGHDDAIARIAQVVRRHYAGFAADRPIGSFLFLGPTGVGKTETARALSRFLFGSPDAMLRVDMSEFSEPHTVSRLIGAPPGYVGYEAGGQLTEQIRRKPFQVVLFDEFEKAHPEVLKILLQILEDGRLTDGQGNTVSFVNTVVIMTSNLGSHIFSQKRKGIGFGVSDTISDDTVAKVLDFARSQLPPELWNRIDEKIVFRPLVREQIVRIAELMLSRSRDRLLKTRRVSFRWDAATVNFLLDNGGFDPAFGARPLRRTIQHYIEAPMADLIVKGQVRSGDMVEITVDKEHNRLAFIAYPMNDEE